jgi:hypothetical protein
MSILVMAGWMGLTAMGFRLSARQGGLRVKAR